MNNTDIFIELVKADGPTELYTCVIDLLFSNTVGGIIYAGLVRAPAGVGIHHAYVGGLIKHYLEMWDAHLLLRETHFPTLWEDKQFNADVLTAIVLHDLHKAYLCFVEGTENLGVFEYGNHIITKTMTPNMISLMLFNKYNVPVSLRVLNSLCNAEGGWAKNPSKVVSSFAKYIYVLDELSSNVKDTETEVLTDRASKYKCKANDLGLNELF